MIESFEGMDLCSVKLEVLNLLKKQWRSTVDIDDGFFYCCSLVSSNTNNFICNFIGSNIFEELRG